MMRAGMNPRIEVRADSGVKSGGGFVNASWKVLMIRLAPTILSVAVAVLVWHWGGGRIDI
jgi:hypothetical protein